MTEKKPMAAVLATIMGEVGRVEKKGKISGSVSYKFARDTDVLEAVTPKMAEAGIVLVPEHQELLSMEPTLSGRQIIANIKTGWLVTDGVDALRFETFGQGADSGDKALPKAQSNARKYAFFMLYHIVTGDDPDQHARDYQQPGQARRPEAQPRPSPAPASPSDATIRTRYMWAERRGWSDDALDDAAIAATGKSVMDLDSLDWQLFAATIKDGPIEQAAEAPLTAAEPEAGAAGTSPAPAEPPQRGTEEYGALDARGKAQARSYWATKALEERQPEPINPEPETLGLTA
jgi:hypothetical protein